MSEFLSRRSVWIALGLLCLANLAVHWPKKAAPPHGGPLGAPPVGDPTASVADVPPALTAEMRQRFEAMLATLPAEQRARVEERRKADEALFDSIRGLPVDERRQKLHDHLAQNPPPDMPPPGEGGPGGTGPLHLPHVGERRGMDQGIVASQSGGNTP